MRKRNFYRALAAIALAIASPAHSIPTTYVSRTGSGTACTLAAPCDTLQKAHDVTDAGGTVRVLDMGEYGPVQITKPITIQAKPGDALMKGFIFGATIHIAGVSGIVVLQGLDLNGTSSGGYGIFQLAADSVYVIDCTIKNYGTGAENYSPSGGGRMFIKHSNILRNEVGVSAVGTGRVVSVVDSLIDNSSFAGVSANANGIIGIARSVINASPTAMQIVNGGQVVSIGPSNVVSGTGAFTATVPFN